MAEELGLDMGFVILAGLAAGVLPAVGGLWFCAWSNKRKPVALRSIPGSSMAEVEAIAHRDEKELPGFAVSIAPVLVPVFLVATASIVARVAGDASNVLVSLVMFAGNKNVALLIGALIAIAVYLKQKGIGWRASEGIVGEPLGTAGVIILITAAGGAYGAMLKGTGIGEVLSTWAENHGIPILLLAWGVSALLKAAQGSTTVAVITTAGLMMAVGGEAGFGVPTILVYLAIGYGGLFMSWMNDSGFWLFCRMGGFTEGETLRSWTVLLSIISLVGLAEVLVLSMFLGTA
jgi:GntP family gluconate:H+ symporter